MKYRLIRGLFTLSAIILTAKLGRVTYNNHVETWYDLPMNRIVERADAYYGMQDVYEVNEDGIKTYNGFVICAADWSVYPYGSLIETSVGTGIVLDHTQTDSNVIDIATSWK